MTWYAAVGGIDSGSPVWPLAEGVMFWRSKINIPAIADGTSSTLVVGERPPGAGAKLSLRLVARTRHDQLARMAPPAWEYDVVQYMSNTISSPVNQSTLTNLPCTFPTNYGPGDTRDSCSFNHFWSCHNNGANFLLADGSVHFIVYTTSRTIMLGMSTRSGGEVVGTPD